MLYKTTAILIFFISTLITNISLAQEYPVDINKHDWDDFFVKYDWQHLSEQRAIWQYFHYAYLASLNDFNTKKKSCDAIIKNNDNFPIQPIIAKIDTSVQVEFRKEILNTFFYINQNLTRACYQDELEKVTLAELQYIEQSRDWFKNLIQAINVLKEENEELSFYLQDINDSLEEISNIGSAGNLLYITNKQLYQYSSESKNLPQDIHTHIESEFIEPVPMLYLINELDQLSTPSG